MDVCSTCRQFSGYDQSEYKPPRILGGTLRHWTDGSNRMSKKHRWYCKVSVSHPKRETYRKRIHSRRRTRNIVCQQSSGLPHGMQVLYDRTARFSRESDRYGHFESDIRSSRKGAVETLVASDADTIIPVVGFSYPPQRAFIIENEKLVFKYPENLAARSQDLEKHYHDAGQFYVFKTDAFRKNKNLLLGNILPLVLDEIEVQDIDTEEDWRLAEVKYKIINE